MATIEKVRPESAVLTPKEVAFAAEVTQKAIEQAIDRKEVSPIGTGRARQREGQRALGFEAAVYMRLRRETADFLTAKARQQLWREISSAGRIPDHVEIGSLRVNMTEAVESVSSRLKALARIQKSVVSDPKIRGGEPVVAGTRIPVTVLWELKKTGSSTEEILESYPAVSKQKLEAALLYAKLYPRRGRPKAPWSDGERYQLASARKARKRRSQG